MALTERIVRTVLGAAHRRHFAWNAASSGMFPPVPKDAPQRHEPRRVGGHDYTAFIARYTVRLLTPSLAAVSWTVAPAASAVRMRAAWIRAWARRCSLFSP